MKHDIRILNENFQTALTKLNENATTPKEEKIVKAKQNGDKSYTVEYSDGTTKTIAVSNDAWDKINDMYGKLTEAEAGKSNPEVDKLLKIMNTKKAGPEYKKALMDLIAMAEKKSGTTVNTKKEALLALDYIEPTIREAKLIEDHTDIKKIIKQIAYLYNDAKKLGHSKASIDNMYQQSNAEAKTQSGDDKNEEAEGFNGEYDDEAGMAHTNLHTIARAAEGLLNTIGDHENLPEWVQEKIAKVEGMIVTAWDYLQSQEEQGIDPEINEMYESMNQLVEDVALKNLVSVDTVWESFEALDDQILYETAAWSRKEGKNKTGGLNAKGVASYRRENPGSKLQTAVTTKPSKLKPGSKAAKRRKSFCARMSGVKGPAKKPNGEPTRKTLALRKWNC